MRQHTSAYVSIRQQRAPRLRTYTHLCRRVTPRPTRAGHTKKKNQTTERVVFFFFGAGCCAYLRRECYRRNRRLNAALRLCHWAVVQWSKTASGVRVEELVEGRIH